jgi:hypothetical protein
LSGRSDRPPLATTRLQPTTTCRTGWSLGSRLCRHIGYRTGQNDLLQRSRLEALHRLEHCVFDLTQIGSRMRLAPGYELMSNCVAQRPPPRQHVIQIFFIHMLLPPAPIGRPERHFTGLRKTTPGTPGRDRISNQ